MKVQDKVAIVTGGAQGLGRGTSLVLAEQGADVVVADINLEGAKSVAEEVVAAGRRSLAVHADVADKTSVERMVEDALARFGNIDILVNNAGIVGASGWMHRQNVTEEDWDEVYAVNVKGIAIVTDAVARHMKERRYGKIVNISSGAGRLGGAGGGPYGVSKTGVINMTQGAALALAPYTINVNAICPGWIWTPMWEQLCIRMSESPKNTEGLTPRGWSDRVIETQCPLKREQTAEDIGYMVAFLVSDYAKNITGQTINVDGGAYMN